MDYELRRMTKDDARASIELSAYAFQNSLTEEEIKERVQNFNINNDRTQLGIYQGNQLCSQLALCDFDFTLQGNTIRCCGIAGVSTWPEYRRGGYVKRLMQESLLMMYNDGQIFSALYPFSVSFYRKFGYELFVEKVRNVIPIQNILKKETAGEVKRIKEYIELREVYEQYALQFEGMLLRSEGYWLNTMKSKKPGFIVGHYHEDKLQGYMIYTIKNRVFHISEFVVLNNLASQALWTFVAQHDSMVHEVEWRSSTYDTSYLSFNDPRYNREIQQEAMGRIVDCQKFIEQYRFNESSSHNHEVDCFIIKIEDEYAKWNDGVHLLKIDKSGHAKLEKYLEPFSEDQVIKVSINILSALLMGYKKLEQYVQYELLKGPTETLKRLQERIPEQKTSLIDYF